jgi:hypothetical protein
MEELKPCTAWRRGIENVRLRFDTSLENGLPSVEMLTFVDLTITAVCKGKVGGYEGFRAAEKGENDWIGKKLVFTCGSHVRLMQHWPPQRAMLGQ